VPDPKFEVKKEGDKHVIRDQNGNLYGSYDTKSQAEENAQLWREYYEAPLVC
jgi:hypothetical protein